MRLIILFALAYSALACVLNAGDIDVEKYFKYCDKPLDNGYFKTCYNYEYKSATASFIELSGVNTNEKNIKLRFDFTEDLNVPEIFRTKDSDFLNSGCDRGHIQSDASNDYSEASRNATYLMSNITMH